MSSILVTGASGFLGGRLVQRLVERGDEVKVLVRRSSNMDHLKDLRLEVVYGDLDDRESLDSATKGAEIVFNCAGKSADWGPWSDFVGVNVTGVRRLLGAARDAKTVKRFVHVSTSDVYGYPEIPCDESYGIRDVGLPYNKSKGMGEQSVWEFAENTGFAVTVVRPVSIFGPRSKDFVIEMSNLIVTGQMMVVNGGRAPAGLLYVDNAVDGLLAAAESPKAVGRAYNLRDETTETWRQYVDALADGLGAKRPSLDIPEKIALAVGRGFEGIYRRLSIESRPLLTRHATYLLCRDQSYSIDRAKNELGFRSNVSFAQGIERTMAWLDSPEGRKAVPRKK